MLRDLLSIFDDRADGLRRKTAGIYILLVAANVGAWLWAVAAFWPSAELLGIAVAAYGLGLRHAVDADHIAAIDNVTRTMMQGGQRPAAVGLFFSLGHSTVVVLGSAAVAATAVTFKDRFDAFAHAGGVIGTAISAAFLLLIAALNLVILLNVRSAFLRLTEGRHGEQGQLLSVAAPGGALARVFRAAFGLVRRSWHMYPLGLLFGLGFDTASEVGLLGIAAAQAGHGMSMWSTLVFPALFTAGMSLVDTTDGLLMLRAYGWAFVNPIRKLYYNMTITFLSVLVAVLLGGIEVLGLVGERLGFDGAFWHGMDTLRGNFGAIGYLVIAVFVATWVISAAIYRLRGYERLRVGTG
ncbi:MAG TPA: HoxN/HupN/NixA family nickel/cobalt transporter [Caldimonas sp.]|nr:HoxN/HupN/NixA family nickel/cobalt transporter [Caldimonas sp.]